LDRSASAVAANQFPEKASNWTLDQIYSALTMQDAAWEQDFFQRAKAQTRQYFGNKIILFAPVYISSYCVNNCLYCGFRKDNHALERKALTAEEIQQEIEAITQMGHQTVLLVAGEHPGYAGATAVAQAVRAARANARIRDIKVEVMPMSAEGYRQLYDAGAETVVLYQETYDLATYAKAHPLGPKSAYAWRLTALDRAVEAGFQRLGIGILLGLRNVVSDVQALILHAHVIYRRFGKWPSTVSLPRLQWAQAAPWAKSPPHPVGDHLFARLVALVRLALPEVGIVLTTRETPAVRNHLLSMGVGVTHLSAGSQAGVGGYTLAQTGDQFSIQDKRCIPEMVEHLYNMGYKPVWSEV